jgi:hypothetical protein
MNERIEKLAEQCWSESKYDPSIEPWFNHRKFAELIVRECLSILDKHYDASVASNDIKEHFGVKR